MEANRVNIIEIIIGYDIIEFMVENLESVEKTAEAGNQLVSRFLDLETDYVDLACDVLQECQIGTATHQQRPEFGNFIKAAKERVRGLVRKLNPHH